MRLREQLAAAERQASVEQFARTCLAMDTAGRGMIRDAERAIENIAARGRQMLEQAEQAEE